MQKAEAIHVQPNSVTTMGPAAACSFSGCMMPGMASSGRESESKQLFEAQLRATLEVIPAYTWYADPSGALTFVNKRLADYLGLPKDHPLRFGIATGAAWDSHIALLHPDDHEESRKVWSTCVRTGCAGEFTFRVRSAEGVFRWFLSRAEPLRASDGTLLYWVGVNLEIDDAKRAEDALRKSEKELREVVDTIPALIHTARPDGYIDYFNKRWLEYFGATLDEVAGWNWTAVIHAEDVEGILARWRACLATGEVFEYETRVRSANGEYRWMFHLKVPLRDANGNIVKWYGSSMDIHDRKTAEEALRSSEAYLAEAQRLSLTGSFGWYVSSGEIFWSDETYRIFEYDRSVKPTIDSVAQRVHPEDRADFKEVINRALAGATDFEHAYRLLLPDGRVKHVHAIADVLQDASGNREFVGAVTDITERKAAEAARRSSEEYLAEAQRLSHTGSWAWNAATGEPSYWSEECYRVLGYDPAEPLPVLETFFQRILPEERAAIREQFDRAIRDKADFEVDLSFVHPITGIRNIHSVSHAVLDQRGDLREIVGTVIDITDRKRAEDERRHAEAMIREQEAELRDVIDTIPAIVWTALPDGSNTYVNKRFAEYSGSSAEQMAGSGWQALVHPDDLDRHAGKWMEAVATGKPLENEVRSRRSDGQYRWQLDRGVPLRDEDGNIVKWYGVTTDIEDRKRAEEDLRASERKYRHLVDTTPAFIHTALPDGSLDFLSRGWLEYGGLPQTDFLDWRWTAAIHPQDVEGFVDKWRAALASGEPFVAESRVKRADGEYRWFLQRNVPLRDETGKIVKWYGTGIDIEERKTAEGKIREQEMELRQMLDFAPQLVSVFGPNRERLYANRVVLDYLGIGLDEWRQRSLGTHVHPDDSERVKACWDRALGSGSGYDVELRLRKHDGSYRWFLARYNPVRDDKGQIMRWYVAGTDIEDRKQAEQRLQHENVALREEIDKASMFEEIVGTSPALKAVLSRISKVAPSDSTVLITGETGTGKELVARAIHRRSNRASRVFVSVNCAATPRDLIASELFGHEKGAFTGATQQRLGRFELANGGTLFLDEVGELPPETQIALLRVLQEHEFERVGGSRPIRADVRVIAATNRDLQAAISAGSFRSDLFYRLHVFPIEIPPLRERKEDILLLVEYFIDRYARKAGKKITTVDKKTLRLLESYPWPGNIRELQNVIERSVIVCETENFSVDESWLSQEPRDPRPEGKLYLSAKVAAQEKEIIEAALRESQGRVFGPSGAAAKLGIARSTLESKIQSLKIDKNRFRV